MFNALPYDPPAFIRQAGEKVNSFILLFSPNATLANVAFGEKPACRSRSAGRGYYITNNQ